MIISQTNVVVKGDLTVNNVNIFVDNKTGEIRDKWKMKKAATIRRADTMKRARLFQRADRVRNCGTQITGTQCQHCGTFEVSGANFCRDRLCPLCSWRLSMKRFAQMLDIVKTVREEEPGAWDMVTLTVRNVEAERLPGELDKMMKAWNSCAATRDMREHCAGWARSLEITYNHATHTFHPHFHVLLVRSGETNAGKILVRKWLQNKYTDASYEAQETHEVKSRWECDESEEEEAEKVIDAILETYKYAVKEPPDENGKTIDDMPLGDFRALANALAGRRLVAFGGIIKYWAKELGGEDIDEDTDEDTEEVRKKCRRCGSSDVVQMCAEWSNGGYKWRTLV